MFDIAIITVVYKNYSVLTDFLLSLERQQKQNFHLIIADASPKRKKISTSLSVTVIPVENKGYAHGINIGLQKARALGIKNYCVINNDVLCHNDFIQSLDESFRKHPQSLFSGKIYYAKGYEYHKDEYRKNDLGNIIWYAGGTVDWAHATTGHISVDEVDHGQFDEECSTEFITGCLMCFNQKIIDTLGYWDEKYFLYYEDADFCERAKKKNIPLRFLPSIKIWHKNAQSTEGSGSELHQKLQKKSHLRYALKYAPFKTKVHVLKNYFFNQKHL